MRKKRIAKFFALALAICVLSPISASGYGTKLDNGRDWFELPGALRESSQGVATSGNGEIVYTLEPNNVRYSADGGATWSDRGDGVDWGSAGWDLATSASGAHVMITANGGYVHVSNDYGLTWTKKTNIVGGCWAQAQGQWRRASMSYSGQYMVVMENCGTVFVSSDYGQTFTERVIDPSVTGQDAIADVEISGDGSRVIVPTDMRNGKVFLSTNYGVTFNEITELTFPDKKNWTTVEVSGDGMTMLACAAGDNIWTSRDGGATWRESVVAGGPSAKDWVAATISNDGQNIGIGRTGTILTSADGGQSWEARAGAPNSRWVGMASSQDGFIMYGNAGGAQIFKSLPTWIWFDKGTVTFYLPMCEDFNGSLASVGAWSVRLHVDTLTAGINVDGSTYAYYTETDTAGWGAVYDYGQSMNAVCEYDSLDGTVTITRGRFISSSPTHSETTTNTTDFIQYIGNTKVSGVNSGNYRGTSCGNLTLPRAASVTTSCTPSILADYSTLTQSNSVLWRDNSQTSGVRGNQSAHAYVVVKVKKTALAGAAGATFTATETFTLTSL